MSAEKTIDNEVIDQAPEVRQARLVAVQDDEGFHLCTGFVKSVKDGAIEFEEQGTKILTYGAYETVIQDLEICLSHAKSMRSQKLAEGAKPELIAAQ